MKILLIALLCVVCQQGKSDYPDKLQLSIFYESKCPDSRRLIKDQLTPAINLLQNYLDIKFVPFGKASSIDSGRGGFQCQHGGSECIGNMVQECVLYHMPGRTDRERVDYVNCEMQNLTGTTGNLMCVQNANVPVERVQQCISSSEGIELQLISEYATKRISPKFIPTITINDKFNQQVQDQSLVDLPGMLCSLLKNPEPCVSHYKTRRSLMSYDFVHWL